METARLIAFPALAAYALAIAFWPVFRLAFRDRVIALLILLPILLAFPLVLPLTQGLARALVAIVAGTMWIKMFDVHIGRLRGEPPLSLGMYVAFLINPCTLVQRRLRDEPAPSPVIEIARLSYSLFALVLGLSLLGLFRPAFEGRGPFLVEHAARAVSVFLFVYAGSAGVTALWRLAGLRGHVIAFNFFASRTPADFWRRYNRHTGQFFHCDVFEPFRLRLGASWAVVATFAINGLGHEYIAAIALGEVQGYQTAFFLIQGFAVATTMRLKPRGPSAIIAMVMTFAFNLFTSLLFLASANQLVGWYSENAPGWMQPRTP